jgi:hypothetical protein
MTPKQRELSDELAARLQPHLRSLADDLDPRLRRVHAAALARREEGVEFDISLEGWVVTVIVCGYGVLGLRASQAIILKNEGLPGDDAIPWDRYADAGLHTPRIVAEELAKFLGERWKQLDPGSIPVTVTYEGGDLDP